jgi:hypothetical protein
MWWWTREEWRRWLGGGSGAAIGGVDHREVGAGVAGGGKDQGEAGGEWWTGGFHGLSPIGSSDEEMMKMPDIGRRNRVKTITPEGILLF